MRIAITGASGLVGSALTKQLEQDGHEVVPLVRRAAGDGEIAWDPQAGTIEAEKLNGLDGVVHLAGDNIGAGRWTAAKKERIRESRVQGTKLLCSTLAQLENKPRVLVSASATGFYGNRGDELLTEDAHSGEGFLAEVCIAWEDATRPATDAGIRVVTLRSGMILSPKEGALAKMLTPFRLGVGGVVGDGHQYWSWITLDDEVRVIVHALQTESLHGPVNAVTPQPVTNREFTKTLGSVLRRPTIFPMPAFGARAALGQMADDLLLASVRVEPTRLLESGFSFTYPDLDSALRHLLR
jgi:uncharacterized protein (TIGR01777 family)